MKKILLILFSVILLKDAYGQVKATSAEINAGIDDSKFATALALQASKYLDQSGAKLYAVTAAGANTYTANISPAIAVYSTGQLFYIKITTSNTGASTLNLNGLGAKALVKDVNTAMLGGELLAGKIYNVLYDGTNFQVINSLAGNSAINNQTGATQIGGFNLSGTGTMSALLTTQSRPDSEALAAGTNWRVGTYVSDVYGHPFTGNNWSANMYTIGTFRITQERGFQISADNSSNSFKIRSLHSVNPSTWRTLWHEGNLNNLSQLPTRNFADLQNKPTTLAGYGVTDKVLKFVAQTSTGNESDYNYWTKIASFNLGTASDYTDYNVQLGFAGYGGTWGSAIVDVGVRQNNINTPTELSVSIMSAGQGINWLMDDSFRLVTEGYGTKIDLYMRKSMIWGNFKIYEMASNSFFGSVTYFSDQGWTATAPTGTYMANSSGIKYKEHNIYHAGNNNILDHGLSTFVAGANSAVTTADNIQTALGKLQGQISQRLDKRRLVTDFNLPAGTGIIEGSTITATNQPIGGQWVTGIQFSANNNATYANQLVFNTIGDIFTRSKPGTTFSAWSKLLTSSNYNAYSPTLTGTGATGSWTIGITGNAATAGKLLTSKTINGVAFDGSSNITITDATAVHKTGNEVISGTKSFSTAIEIGSGTSSFAGYKLAVRGNILAENIKLNPQIAWPDYVFEKDYPLRSLSSLEQFLFKNKHLPEMPSAEEVQKEGLDIAEMNAKLLKKVEELTLYLIQKNKEMEKTNAMVKELRSRIEKIERRK